MKYKIVVSLMMVLVSSALYAKTEAKVNGVKITSKQVDELSTKVKAQMGKEIPRKELVTSLIRTEAIKQNGYASGIGSSPTVIDKVRQFKDKMVIDAYIQSLAKDIAISDQELKVAYDNLVKTIPKIQYKASHILVKKLKEAKAIIKSLARKDADFAKIAQAKSIGPSSKNGGALGWFNPKTMVKEFADAVKKLKKGKYTSKPVKTKFGYHVILLEDIKDAKPPKFADVRGNLTNQLLQPKLLNKIENIVKKTKVKRF